MNAPSGETHGPFGHLDAASWRALQNHEPAAVAYFARHLAAPCETCEAFLAEAPGQDALDALTDEALVAAAGSPPREDSLGWERVRRRAFPSRARQWSAGLGALAAVAAAALVFLVVKPLGHAVDSGSGERVKGGAPLVLELTAAAQLPGGSVLPVAEGQSLPPEAVVLLRYHVSEASEAVLVREVPGKAPEALGRFSLEPGTHDLEEASGLTGVSLEGERGELSLALVALPPGTRSEDALSQAAGPGAVGARIHFRVQSGDDPSTGH